MGEGLDSGGLAQFDRLSTAGSTEETTKYDEDFVRKWGFPLKDLYRLALNFYREKEGKAVTLSYQDRLKLVALSRQVAIGKFQPDHATPSGVFNVIGRDRRLAWQSLGDMSAEDAMVEFIELLDDRCPLFRPFSQAHKANLDNMRLQTLQEKDTSLEENGQGELTAEEHESADNLTDGRSMTPSGSDMDKHAIMKILNEQTYEQFKSYAEQHFPGDTQQQASLIHQLQNQHYEQLIARLRLDPSPQPEQAVVAEPADSDDDVIAANAICPASMWTLKDIKGFKASMRREGGEAIIKVGHGDTVTVRVPTNEETTCIFWEFATDYYDIGFGVYFEWTKSPTNQVSVHVSESEDEDDYGHDDDDDDEDDEEFGLSVSDVERGVKLNGRSLAEACRPPLTEIIPVRRRDCMDQVYAGSHPYPGTGVYLLKFDNSYSLWRSKTLYYRVYYSG